MTIHHQSQRDRIDAGLGFEWDLLPRTIQRVADVPPGTAQLVFQRVGNSHRGIARLEGVQTLLATGVNQDFLEEICSIRTLETLRLSAVTAHDLSAVKSLPRLKRLSVIGATKVEDLAWLPTQPSLQALALENLKRVHDLTALSELVQLQALGVEGSMWTPMRVRSLAPLSALVSLEFLFMTNLRLEDWSLQPLHALHRLKALHSARFYPRTEFLHLSAARPKLRCDWFEAGNWERR